MRMRTPGQSMARMENRIGSGVDNLYESQHTDHNISKQDDVHITPRNIFSAPINVQDSSRFGGDQSGRINSKRASTTGKMHREGSLRVNKRNIHKT